MRSHTIGATRGIGAAAAGVLIETLPMNVTKSSQQSRAYRRVTRSYRRLVRVLNQVMRDPEAMLAQPVDHLRAGSIERRLLEGLRAMVERMQLGKEELRHSEERFKLAMEGASDGLWDWNFITDEVYYSPRWKQMLGYADHELPNEFGEWRRRVHPDDYDRVMAAIEAYREGITSRYQTEVR